MTDYSELVKALRSASTVSTAWEKLMLDAAAAIEELETEIRESMQKCAECGDANMPKRGEWIWQDAPLFGNPYGSYKCKCCGCSMPHKTNYCPNCGAKMEVQDG